jgi:hypothetical protein
MLRDSSRQCRLPTSSCSASPVTRIPVRRFLHVSSRTSSPSSSAPTRPDPADDGDTFAGQKAVAYQMPNIHSTLKPSFLRPTLFAAAVAAGAYVWAAYATNEDTAKQEKAFRARSNSFFAREPTDEDLANTRRTELLQNAKQFLIRHLGNPPDTKSTKTRLFTLVTEWCARCYCTCEKHTSYVSRMQVDQQVRGPKDRSWDNRRASHHLRRLASSAALHGGIVHALYVTPSQSMSISAE